MAARAAVEWPADHFLPAAARLRHLKATLKVPAGCPAASPPARGGRLALDLQMVRYEAHATWVPGGSGPCGAGAGVTARGLRPAGSPRHHRRGSPPPPGAPPPPFGC